MKPRHALACLALAVLALHALVLPRIPARGFVTVDLGALYLQYTGLATKGEAALPAGPLLQPIARDHWPWRLSDTPPARIDDWSTVTIGWFTRVGERFLVIYPVGFAWLSALAMKAMGEVGPPLIPLLSGALAAWATGLLALRLGARRPHWALAVAGVASPLTLYAVLVWGHAPAIAASAVGFALLSGGREEPSAWGTLLSGLAFGAAGAFRNEGLLMAAIVAVLVWLVGPRPAWRHGPAFALGLALALSGPLAYNHATFGTWLDPAAAGHAGITARSRPAADEPSLAERAAVRAARAVPTAWECLVRSDNLSSGPQAVIGGLLLASLFALAVALNVRAPGLARFALLALALTSGAYLAFAWAVRPQQVPGLFLCAPALVPGVAALFAPAVWRAGARVPVLATLLFLAGCAQRGSPGWQWGARYMLLALPVLAALAARALDALEDAGLERGQVALHAAVLLVIGAGMSVIGWRDLASEQRFREEEQAVVRELAAPVVAFDHWWFSWENAPLTRDHELMFVGDATQLGALLEHLTGAAVRRVALVTRGRAPELAAYESAAAARGWKVAERRAAALPYGLEWHALAFSR